MHVSRRAALKGIVAGAVGAAAGTAVYGVAYERHHLGVTQAVLPVRGLPPNFSGLRVALLTDIHHSALVGADDVRAAVDLALSLRPDLIVLGGDSVTFADRTFVEPVAELLAPLQAPLGVFAILGNHDDDREMAAALRRREFVVLKDQIATVPLRGEKIDLVGIRFWTRQLSTLGRLLKKAQNPALLLAHDPRRLTEAAALDIPGVLSGHTHGGQVVIPGIGAIAKARFPVVAGLGQRSDTSIFVSRGIGTVYVPVRINCPPEVALITLQSSGHPRPS